MALTDIKTKIEKNKTQVSAGVYHPSLAPASPARCAFRLSRSALPRPCLPLPGALPRSFQASGKARRACRPRGRPAPAARSQGRDSGGIEYFGSSE